MRIPRFTAYTLAAILILLEATAVSAQLTTTTSKSANFALPTVSTTTTTTQTTDFILPTPISSSTSYNLPVPTSSTGNSTLGSSCPGPLIPNKLHLQIPTCVGECCVKCPAYKAFYPPNKAENILSATYVIRQISLGCAVFMAISYLVLPGKRSQPHISVLFLMISLSLWYAAFDIMPGTSNACVNDFEYSTWSNSNLCAAQGVLIVYFTQTSALWCALLIYKLHMLAVWQSDIIDRYYGWLTAFCWVFPLGFAITLAAKRLSQFPGIGFSCLVSTQNLNLYLFYPLAVYIYPALLCHAFTVAKMIQLAILSSKVDTAMSQLSTNARMKLTSSMQAKRLLRGQWRPALMLATVMTSITVFWLFYYIDAHRLSGLSNDTAWVKEWAVCLFSSSAKGLSSDETQATCADLIKDNVPSMPWFGAAESLVAIIGIVVALVFVSKADFWAEWATAISSLFGRDKPERDNEQPDTPDSDKPPVIDRSNSSHYQYNDPNMRKGTRVGYNDELPVHAVTDNKPLPGLDGLEVPQWYDMDDLLDREYDLQDTNPQGNTSYGSRAGITSASSQIPSIEPPRYLASASQDLYSGDILYTPPVKEIDPWATSSPSKAYLVANDSSDRYVEQPVVPRPVPRASIKLKNDQQQQPRQQQIQEQALFLSTPQSPTFIQTSLSPMPPKPLNQPSTPFLPRKKEPDSASIPSSAQGSPATGYAAPPSGKAALFYSNDSNEKIMVASRESVTGTNGGSIIGRGLSKIMSHRQSSDFLGRSSPKKVPSALDLEIKSSTPPTIPLKSPARRQNSISKSTYHSQEQGESQGSYSQSTPTSPASPASPAGSSQQRQWER